ncbi:MULTISPECIES: hypothetical protein [unclassified Pseudofrankia]|uniref:hypothetical protein n=1 Tax=unclassified Pseudofrankia TaxID=2994372 RepID=UPI0008DA1E95|nr:MULTISPECIES: hypothetical protein [unclassified Pseudofrankia]MDT3443733.1 hypothetical protein [Pseudofrankia sp. BMG5.37]OHV50044.1 hypothetical protein BCD48_12005 [Pseudofrankia sp. BMG5.36]
MVKLRSTRQDRTLLIAVWVLTVIVLVLGGLAKSPILLVWGTVGLIAAIYLTRVHFRDTRSRGLGPDIGSGGPPGSGPGDGEGEDAAPGQPVADATAKTDTSDVEESR